MAGENMRIVCCSCNKVETPKGWRPLRVKAGGRLSHGFCPSCHRQTMRLIAAHNNRADCPAAVA